MLRYHNETMKKKERQDRFEARKAEKEREKEEKKKLAEAEQQGKTIEQVKEEIQAQVAKKPKTKVVTKKDAEGYNVKVVVDKSGNEIKEKDKVADKKEVEPAPEKEKEKEKKSKKNAPSTEPPVDDSNLFSIADDFEDVPSPNDYQISLREAKQKGMEKSQQNKKKHPTPAPKPGDKEKKAKEKAKQEKAKQEKVPAPKKLVPPAVQQQSTDVPFFQNELVKPLVYVVALVSLLSVIYLIMS